MSNELRVLDLSIKFYHQCENLKIKFHLKQQLSRSSSSISLNISEGCGKLSHKDQRKYFNIAYASLRESLTALKLSKIQDPELLDLADHIGGCLYKLMHKPPG